MVIVLIIRVLILKLSKTLIQYATYTSSTTRLKTYKGHREMAKKSMRKYLLRGKNLQVGDLSGCKMEASLVEMQLIAKFLAH